jgi:hypothetical protein
LLSASSFPSGSSCSSSSDASSLDVLEVRVLALLVVRVVVVLDEHAVLDHAAPGARLELAPLDERLEAVQVRARGALDVFSRRRCSHVLVRVGRDQRSRSCEAI